MVESFPKQRVLAAWLLAGFAMLAAGGWAPVAAQYDPEDPLADPLLVPEEERLYGEEEGEETAEPLDPEALLAAEQRVERITFQVPFPAEKGGGTAVGSAGNIEFLRDTYVVASGGVELRFQDFKVQADRVEVDLDTQQLTASGDVIIDQGPKRLIGESCQFDLETKTGIVYEAKAFVDPDIYFEGREIEKTGEDTYVVKKGRMSSCVDASPDWSFRMSRASVKVDGFAKVKNARFHVKKAPILYWPYMVYPANQDRKSGLLFPNVGYSNRYGAVLGLAYFQTMGPSYDATLYADAYGEDYLGGGLEFRYKPTLGTTGRLETYVVDDPESSDLRWKLFWTHTSENLPLGLRGVVRYQDFSDFDFFRDFERDFGVITVRRLNSAGYLTGSWGQHSTTLLVDQSKTFFGADSELTLRQVPELEYRMRQTQLGRLPLFLEVLSSANSFSINRTGGVGGDSTENYSRADLFPKLTASLSTLPWLNFTMTAGGRVTYYTDSLNEERTEFTGESLTRTFATFTSRVIGPSFSRVFDKKKPGRFARYKHIFEPRWNYGYASTFDDNALVPVFDQVDTLRGSNFGGVALVNRLLAKPTDETLHGGAREIMSLELNMPYSFDADRPIQIERDPETGEIVESTAYGPVGMRYRYNPTQLVSLESQASFNTLFNNLTSFTASGGLRMGPHAVGLTWATRFQQETGDTIGNQVRFFGGVELWPTHFRLDAQINYDFKTGLLQSQRYVFQYFSQCWGARLELREFKTIDRTDRDVRFAMSLKNIGTFLDLSGGTRNGFQSPF